MNRKPLFFVLFFLSAFVVSACGGGNSDRVSQDNGDFAAEEVYEEKVLEEEEAEEDDEDNAVSPAYVTHLPYSESRVGERVVLDYGKRTIRMKPDATISNPELMKKQQRCFIVMSKKDCYVYVYEAQGADTVLLARYDATFALRKGNKERSGDMRTPESTMEAPFEITQIQDASTWEHDFNDGRGAIKSYGDYFLRLLTPGHKGIGIHGSTNNAETVPGRASEGCIRLRDKDLIDLARNYAFVGMKVVIKGEKVDDYPFETLAMQRQNIERLRHLNPSNVLSNEQIEAAKAERGRVAKSTKKVADAKKKTGKDNAQQEGKGVVVTDRPNPARSEKK